MENKVKIMSIDQETQEVKRFILEKPRDLSFIPGHSIMISLPQRKEEKRPFSFTSTNEDFFLEFFIKVYTGKDSVTEQLHRMKAGQELILSDIFSLIRYTRPGIFLAAGTGITPFLSILRQLKKEDAFQGNKLFYSEKRQDDFICRRELKQILGKNVIFTITRESREGYEHGRINESLLKKHITNFDQEFYICGADSFISDMHNLVQKLKAQEQTLTSYQGAK